MASVTSLGFNIFSSWSGKGVRDAVKDVSGFSDRMQQTGKRVRGVGETMSATVTTSVAAVGTAAIATAGDFEQSMQRVAAVSGATGSEMEEMTELAKELGSSTQFSASQAAEGMQFLSMAGFDTKETMSALPGVLDLAAAGATDLGSAADTASNILSGYGMEASEVGEVNDVLAKTFSSTNTDLSMLGESFKVVAPIANDAGLAFEETSAAIGLLGNAGIQGSEAGTALRSSISRLLNPTDEVSSALSGLGVSVTDAQGELLPLVDIVGQLEDAGADTADLMTIFGEEAGPAMASLVGEGSDALKGLTGDLQNAGGTASEIAETQMEGFNGGVKELKSALQSLAIEVADSGLLDWATQLTEKVTSWVQSASQAHPWLLKLGVILGVVAAVVGPLLIVIGALISAIGAIGAVMTPVVGVVAAVVAGIAALGAALVLAWKRSEQFRGAVMGAWDGIKAGWNALWKGALKPGIDALVGIWKRVWPTIKQTALSAWDAVMAKFEEIRPKFQRIFDRIATIVKIAVAIIQSVWDDHGDTVMSVISFIQNVFVARLKGAFQIITSVIKGVWQIITGIFSGALDVISGLLDVFIGLFTGDWRRMWDGVKRIFSGVWTAVKSIFQGAVTILKGIVSGLITGIVKPFKWLWNWLVGNSLIPDLVNSILGWITNLRDWLVAHISMLVKRVIIFFKRLWLRARAIWRLIKNWITEKITSLRDAVIARVSILVKRVVTFFKRLRLRARAIWRLIRNWIVDKAESLRDKVVDTVTNLKDKVIDAFSNAKDGVKKAWNKLEGVAKEPVSFVINTVYNKGIVGVWNKVAEKVDGIGELDEFKPDGFAGGGVLPGFQGAKRDDVMTPMRSGEGVLVPEVVRGLGPGFVHSLNAMGNSGGVSAVRKLSEQTNEAGLGQAPKHGSLGFSRQAGFAKGGVVGEWISDKWDSIVGKVKDWALKPLNKLRDKLSGKFGKGDDFSGIPYHIFQGWKEKMLDRFGKADKEWAAMGGADSWVGLASASERLQRAATFARAQAGKPYVWGGAGPGGYDCSGFMAAIENKIRGVGPYSRRYTTHNFSGGGPPGWERGLRSPFQIGNTHSGVGHQAGTLMGVNVESRGSRGVVVGSGARGAGSGMFTSRWGFAPVAGDSTAKGKARGGVVADSGATLTPGLNLLNNRTGAPEPLQRTDREQEPAEVHLYLHGDDEEQLRRLRKQIRIKGGNVQTVLGNGGRR